MNDTRAPALPTAGRHVGVRVMLYANMTRFAPGAGGDKPFDFGVPGAGTVADLLAALEVPDRMLVTVLIGGRHVFRDTRLQEGDEVAVFPVMAGG